MYRGLKFQSGEMRWKKGEKVTLRERTKSEKEDRRTILGQDFPSCKH